MLAALLAGVTAIRGYLQQGGGEPRVPVRTLLRQNDGLGVGWGGSCAMYTKGRGSFGNKFFNCFLSLFVKFLSLESGLWTLVVWTLGTDP